MRLEDKLALIAGGARGIGRAIAERYVIYCATKAAVISITQSMALELIKHRINVNAIRGASVFLASPDSDYIVARTPNVDGGNWMS
jgi:galactitol 2-dehydrogenase